MSLLTRMKYSFVSKGMDKETFTVISFKGFEAISQPYRFEILMVSDKTDIDPLDVLQNPATFTIHRDQESDVDFNGILMQFEETQEFDGYLFFKAVLAPKLWWLSLTHHNQIFLDLSVPEIMEQALKDGGLNPGVDFSFELKNSYDALEYVCQYGESHFDFVSRWAQREGIYYFFEQTPTGEKIIFSDDKIVHKDLALGKDLVYHPQSGLDSLHTKEVIKNFVCRHNMLPKRVYLKDYNYLKPSQAVEGIADVDENGRGENYIYGVHFDTVEQGNHLAKIRAQALLCRKSVFHGESSVPFVVPGYTFDLNDYYKESYNKKYLVTEVTHEGHQTGYLISGLGKTVEARDQEMFYSNSFTAIYSSEQFRPEHLAQIPKISGTINAKIDAAGSGEYAELDEHGRYKVILPFDRSGRSGGKASAWMRMMQPYAGQNQGMHFPLHKSTEVLLTFIDGNPDRPLIAGAVPNPETGSPVNAATQTKSIIRSHRTPQQPSTVGAAWSRNKLTKEAKKNIKKDKRQDREIGELQDNFIEFDDGAGNERISIHSGGDLWMESKDRYGEYHSGMPDDPNKHIFHGDKGDGYQGGAANLPSGYGTSQPHKATADPIPLRGDLLDKFGSDYNPTGLQSRHERTTSGAPATQTFDAAMKQAHVHISSMDTVNTQEGNVYDFGGYWVYNLGNGYIENHMAQKTWDNKTYPPAPTTAEIDASKISDPDVFTQTGKSKVENDHADECAAIDKLNEENAENAILNRDLSLDLLNKGGPYWNSVDWSKARGFKKDYLPTSPGSSTSEWQFTNVQILPEDAPKIGEESDWKEATTDKADTSVWVEKSFGNSYSYKEGDAIDIAKGNTLNIQHAHKDIDIVFRKDGELKSWEKTESGTVKAKTTWDKMGRKTSDMTYGDGVLKQTTWNYFAMGESAGPLPILSYKKEDKNTGTTTVHTHCRDTGNLIAVSSKHQGANSTHSYTMNWANTAKASLNFAAGAAFSLNLSEQGKFSVNISADQSLKLNLSSVLSLNISATFNFAINFQAGFQGNVKLPFFLPTLPIATPLPLFTWDCDMGTIKMVTDHDGLSVKFFGMELHKPSPVKLSKEEINILKKSIDLKSETIKVSEGQEVKI